MKHLEELKIGVTAALFCMVMLLVYAVFPKDGLVQTTKAPMPEVPTAETWSEEEDYGFQIYSQESNYDDSYSYEEDHSYEEDNSYQEGTDTADQTQPETVDGSTADTPSDTENTGEQLPPDDSYVEEPSVDPSFDDIPEEDTSGDTSSEEDFNWNETEETYNFEE